MSPSGYASSAGWERIVWVREKFGEACMGIVGELVLIKLVGDVR